MTLAFTEQELRRSTVSGTSPINSIKAKTQRITRLNPTKVKDIVGKCCDLSGVFEEI